MKVLVATYNKKKLREITRIFKKFSFTFAGLSRARAPGHIEEDRPTFRENASLKARVISRRNPRHIVIADDSGLIVPALGGRPGVHSARFSGPKKRDSENNKKLLLLMKPLRGKARKAYFICTVAIAHKGKVLAVTEGVVRGRIAMRMEGKRGFGYDPLFIPQGHAKTFAALGEKIKDTLSHRTKALIKAGCFIRKNFSR
jgi:XTP/dITP diphosphohydrolase